MKKRMRKINKESKMIESIWKSWKIKNMKWMI